MNIKPPCCNDVGLAAASLRSNREVFDDEERNKTHGLFRGILPRILCNSKYSKYLRDR